MRKLHRQEIDNKIRINRFIDSNPISKNSQEVPGSVASAKLLRLP